MITGCWHVVPHGLGYPALKVRQLACGATWFGVPCPEGKAAGMWCHMVWGTLP